MKRKGISLVALVITIIVLIILTAAVMMVFSEGGIIDKANYATYTSNIRTMQESFQMNTQKMMLENIGFNGSQINVHEEDENFKEELEKAIPILSTLKNKSIKGRNYDELVQIYDGKLYWSDTIENSINVQDKEIQKILTEMGIESYFEKVYATEEYKIIIDIDNSRIIGFIGETKSDKEVKLPNICRDEDEKEYVIKEIMRSPDYKNINQQYPNLEKVILPKGYTYIDIKTFMGCNNLKEVVLPKTLKWIGEQTFFSCKKLEKINFQDGLEDIGTQAFWGCENLTNINLPDSIKTIENGAFSQCKGLENVNIPNGLTVINKNTFNSCTNLKRVTFGTTGNLKTIGNNVFANCTSWGSLDNDVITIPEGVTSIGSLAFSNCTSLRTVNLPSTLNSIDSNAFNGCDSSLIISINKKESECSSEMKSNLSSMGFTINYEQ